MIWDAGKPVHTKISAISPNLLCQNIPVPTASSYDIERVALYLERVGSTTEIVPFYGEESSESSFSESSSSQSSPSSSSNPYDVIINIYNTDLNGKPDTLVGGPYTLSSATINDSGWYFFEVGLTDITRPDSNLLSIVFTQDGGGADDYVVWHYSSNPGQTNALFCTPPGEWVVQSGVARAVKVLDGSDLFTNAYDDSVGHYIETPPGEQVDFNQDDFENGTADGTAGGSGSIELTHKNVAMSIVVDGSGSAGWGDRTNQRSLLMKKMIEWLPANYPGDVVIDALTFGGKTATGEGVSSNKSTYAARWLPTTTATKYNLDGTTETAVVEDESLTRVVAYGFKNLEAGHQYLLASIMAHENTLESGEANGDGLLNMQNLGPSANPLTFQVKNDGPANASGIAIDVPASGSNAFRRPMGVQRQLVTSRLDGSAAIGDTILQVDSTQGYASATPIDIIDSDVSLRSVPVARFDGTRIELQTPLQQNVGDHTTTGGFVQESNDNLGFDLSKMTGLQIWIKDPAASQAIIFYLETADGSRFEWPITAYTSWVSRNLAFLDETMMLSIGLADENGVPYLDGSEIELFVDEKPGVVGETTESVATTILNTPAEGDQYIEIDPDVAADIKVNSSVVFTDGVAESNTYVIWKIDRETGRLWVLPVIEALAFTPTSITVEPPLQILSSGAIPMRISAVDTTPIAAGRNIDWEPGNPPPVANTSNRNDFNTDSSRRLDDAFSIPSIYTNDAAIAEVNILPVLVDDLQQPDMSWLNQPLDPEDIPVDEDLEDEISSNEEDESSSPSTESQEREYQIETPIQTLSGQALSHMRTRSKEIRGGGDEDFGLSYESLTGDTDPSAFVRNSPSLNIGKHLSAKSYKIYPFYNRLRPDGALDFRQELDTIDATFAATHHLFSRPDSTRAFTMARCKRAVPFSGGEYRLENLDIYGTYASSGNSITIDYAVAEKFWLLRGSGTLRVKIFDCTRSQQDIQSPAETNPDLMAEVPALAPDGEDLGYAEAIRPYFARTNASGQTPMQLAGIGLSEATHIPDYPEGGYELDLVNGVTSLEIPALDVVARLLVVAEFQWPGTADCYSMKQDMIWFTNPLRVGWLAANESLPTPPIIAESGSEVYTDSTEWLDKNTSFPAGLDQNPGRIHGVVQWMGSAAPDGVGVAFAGSSHQRNIASSPGLEGVDQLAEQLDRLNPLTAQQFNIYTSKSEVTYLEQLASTTGTWPASPIITAIAYTNRDSGQTDEVSVGPHGPVTSHTVQNGDELEAIGDSEAIYASTTYGGFTVASHRMVEWTGNTGNTDYFYDLFIYDLNGNKIGSGSTVYADGWDGFVAVGDLPYSVENRHPEIAALVDTILGKTADGTPVGTGAKPVTFRFENGFNSSTKWGEDPPLAPNGVEMFQASGRGYAASKVISSSHTVQQPCPRYNADGEVVCPSSGCCMTISSVTYARDNAGVMRKIDGCDGDAAEYATVNKKGEIVPVLPTILWAEPLAGTYYINGQQAVDNGLLTRDSQTLNEVMLDVTFSGLPIPQTANTHNVRNADGSRIGMPTVTFDAFKVVTTTDPDTNATYTEIVRDADTNINNPSVIVTNSRTSIDADHYHLCEVDNAGNGTTTSTVGATSHSHAIANYLVEGQMGHGHTLRSVASTLLGPITDPDSEIHVIAMVKYDASRTPVERTINVEYVDSVTTETDKYELLLLAPKKVDAKQTPAENGFVVRAELRKTSAGLPVDITDGHPIFFEFKTYLPKNYSQKRANWTRGDDGEYEDQDYVVIEVKASTFIDDIRLAKSTKILVQNNKPFEPMVVGLLPEPTGDSLYLDAIQDAASFGPSPIHDAVYQAAGRLKSWQLADVTRRNWTNAIVLISDGWENGSTHSILEAIDAIHALAGHKKTPCSTTAIGQPTPWGNLILRKYSEDTNSAITTLTDGPQPSPSNSSSESTGGDEALTAMVENILQNGIATINYGTYIGEIDLERSKTILSITFDITVPPGGEQSLVQVRWRFSDDGETWGSWSAEQELTETTSIAISSTPPTIKRYIQYWIGFVGNSDFIAPTVTSVNGVAVEPRESIIFLSPIYTNANSEQGVGKVVVSDKTSGRLSSVSYGYTASDSTNEQDYLSISQPLSPPANRKIILSRVNEPLVRLSATNYQMLNQGWPGAATLEVYDLNNDPLNGELISPNQYTANPTTGRIVFTDPKPNTAKFSATLIFPPLFRILCRVVNYSAEAGDAAKIHHIGVSWNLTNLRSSVHASLGDLISSSSSSPSMTELRTTSSQVANSNSQ